jgi:hypothetical protein
VGGRLFDLVELRNPADSTTKFSDRSNEYIPKRIVLPLNSSLCFAVHFFGEDPTPMNLLKRFCQLFVLVSAGLGIWLYAFRWPQDEFLVGQAALVREDELVRLVGRSRSCLAWRRADS